MIISMSAASTPRLLKKSWVMTKKTQQWLKKHLLLWITLLTTLLRELVTTLKNCQVLVGDLESQRLHHAHLNFAKLKAELVLPSSNTQGKLNIFGHDCDAFSMDCAKVRVFKQSNNVRFCCLLKSF